MLALVAESIAGAKASPKAFSMPTSCLTWNLPSSSIFPPARISVRSDSHSRARQVRGCETVKCVSSFTLRCSDRRPKASSPTGSSARSRWDFGCQTIWTFGTRSSTRMQAKGEITAELGGSTEFDRDQIPLLRQLLAGLVRPYLKKNPTAMAALDLIRKQDPGVRDLCAITDSNSAIKVATTTGASTSLGPYKCWTVTGCGIDAIAQGFLDMGYKTRDELRFPGKKLRALWYSPPECRYDVEGELENGPLPRIFVSEILVDQLSNDSQQIIQKYTKAAGLLSRHALVGSVLDTLTWPTPSLADYQQLASESEYAAWTLVHGYALNHATVSVHRLHQMHDLDQLNDFLQHHNIKLNSEGGISKVSPDGGLLQSSSIADSLQYRFSDSEVSHVPASYIEFAQRLVLPVYSHLKDDEISERHRRDGFEVGNADKIFESTSSDQTGVRMA